MSDIHEEDYGDLEVAVEFHPVDRAAARLVEETFAEDEVFVANAFTGTETVTVVVSAARAVLGRVLGFFAQHRQSFKDAVIKIGPEEISMTGYTMDEVRGLLDSDAVRKLLREMKK